MDLVHPTERSRLGAWLRRRGSETEPIVRDQLAVKRRDGTALVLAVVGTPTVYEGAPAVQVAVHDMTAQRALEVQMNQSQKLQAVGQLAAGIAHDFNNLLTVIRGHGELLLEGLEPTNPIASDIAEMLEAANRASVLTNQLLAFSRKQVLQARALDVNDVVGSLQPMLRRVIGADVGMVLHQAGSIGHVMADQGQIEQVLLNLVVNARDAMPSGGTITITTADVELDAGYAARRDVVAPGPYVMLAVTDTGSGMSPEILNRVFEPFFTTKEQGKGTGLGLASVYGIVKQSEGYVWAYSEKDEGSTFKVYLPRLRPGAARPRAEVAPVRAAGGRETVLLVEDESGVRALAQRILTRQGYTVLVAEDGQQALELAASYPGRIDALLTDMIMPRMGGSELSARLDGLRPGTRVLYMSGYTDDTIVKRGLLHSTVAFLEKPFTANALLLALRGVLDGDAAPERGDGSAGLSHPL
jgi:signal transduction histidine kinase/CheY-like chemotaxis protein